MRRCGIGFSGRDLGAKGVFYRLQAGPLADAGRAKGLCEALARRNVRCLVITP